MSRSHLAMALVLVAFLGSARPAVAQRAAELRWSPRADRFRESEHALSAALAMTLLASHLWLHPRSSTGWNDELALDHAARSLLAGESRRERERAATVSDVLAPALLAYPLAVDALLIAGVARGSGDVALQLSLIGVESFLVAAVITDGTKKLVARARPDASQCMRGSEPACREKSESFFSSHTAFAFTGAGLICAQHQSLPLYGPGPWGAIICGAALGAATAVGALRIVADRHYFTDVMGGAAVGLAAGYLLPNLLHYGFGSGRAEGASARLIPFGERGLVGLAYSRTF